MLVAPYLPNGLSVGFKEPPSWPYVKMTQGLLEEVGVVTDDEYGHAMRVSPSSRVKSFSMDIEPDASGATYPLAAAALFPGAHCVIAGLGFASFQGDSQFLDILAAAGANPTRTADTTAVHGSDAIHPINVNLSDMPDTAMTAAVLACFGSPTPDNPTATTMLRGLRTLRVKETDRLAALQTELTKLGAHVEILQDGRDESLRITPPPRPPSPHPAPSTQHPALFFDTYHDHRMAMALALIGLRVPNVYIRNPACVAKTYATFWRDLAKLYPH
jgi:3-phosphoshikimate 1-carboxyvinyltransferase